MAFHAVYHGLVRDGSCWLHSYAFGATADDVDGAEPNFYSGKKMTLRARPGNIYEIAGTYTKDDGIKYTKGSAVFVRRAVNSVVIGALANANDMAKRAQLSAEVPWTKCLEPARIAYQKAYGIQRRMILRSSPPL